MRSFIVIAGFLLLALTGLAAGLWSNRWSTGSVGAVPGQLSKIPLEIQEWAGRSNPMNDREQAVGQIDDYAIRQYQNTRDGTTLLAMVVGGRAGPISVHTPDVCFPGAGFKQVGATILREIPGTRDNVTYPFRTAEFVKVTGGQTTRIRVYWSWLSTEGWSTPAEPRIAFARESALYKVYIVEEITGSNRAGSPDAAAQFIPLFLTEVEACLQQSNRV
jgi:hypothetical protein